MRVAYDHHIFSAQHYGGISRYFAEIATRIHRLEGFQVSILSPLCINEYMKTYSSLPVWSLGVDVSGLPQRVVRGINSALVRAKLRHDPPEIVHETYYLRSRLAPPKSKTIVTVHDMIHEKFPQYFPSRDTTSKCKKAAVQRAERIICVSESTRTDLLNILEVDPEKVSVVHHGSSAAGAGAKTTERLVERPYIAFVGTRVGYKNFHRLLEVFGMSPFLKNNFAILCFGGGKFTADELRQAANLEH